MQHYMKGCQNAGCNTEKTERNFPWSSSVYPQPFKSLDIIVNFPL